MESKFTPGRTHAAIHAGSKSAGGQSSLCTKVDRASTSRTYITCFRFGLYQSLDIQFQVSEPWPQYYLVPRVYQPNPHFVGRDNLIEDLRQKLHASQPETYNHRVALFGMGGVGKTQLAVHYVFKHKSEYESVFWISAATRADFQTGFQQIAEKIKCVNNAGNDADAVAKAVLAWLKTRTSYLLIID